MPEEENEKFPDDDFKEFLNIPARVVRVHHTIIEVHCLIDDDWLDGQEFISIFDDKKIEEWKNKNPKTKGHRFFFKKRYNQNYNPDYKPQPFPAHCKIKDTGPHCTNIDGYDSICPHAMVLDVSDEFEENRGNLIFVGSPEVRDIIADLRKMREQSEEEEKEVDEDDNEENSEEENDEPKK